MRFILRKRHRQVRRLRVEVRRAERRDLRRRRDRRFDRLGAIEWQKAAYFFRGSMSSLITFVTA